MKKEARENSKHVDFEVCTQENKASEIESQSPNPTCVHTFYTSPLSLSFILASNAGMEASYLKNAGCAGGPNLEYGSTYTGTQDTQDTQVRP